MQDKLRNKSGASSGSPFPSGVLTGLLRAAGTTQECGTRRMHPWTTPDFAAGARLAERPLEPRRSRAKGPELAPGLRGYPAQTSASFHLKSGLPQESHDGPGSTLSIRARLLPQIRLSPRAWQVPLVAASLAPWVSPTAVPCILM